MKTFQQFLEEIKGLDDKEFGKLLKNKGFAKPGSKAPKA